MVDIATGHGFVIKPEDELGLQLWQKHTRFRLGPSTQLNDSDVFPSNKTMLQIGASSNSSSTMLITEDHQVLAASVVGGVAFVTFSIFLWAWSSLKQNPDKKSSRSALHSLLSPHSHRPQAVLFRSFIAILILMNIGALLVQSIPVLGVRYGMELDLLEAVSAWIFFVEYCMRLYVIPESKRYKAKTALNARLCWMITFESVIDLLSFTPWFIEQGADILYPTKDVELPAFTWLRIIRLFRLFKVSFVSESIDVFARVLYYNSEILIVSMILCAVLTLLLSILLFYVGPKGDPDFNSIPACMYLAVMMLTGQGEPEGVLPWYTKLVVCVTCVFAVGLFAIQASMLTWGFENEAERRVKRQKKEKIDKVEAILGGDEDGGGSCSSSSSDDEVNSDWEEYEGNLAEDDEAASDAGDADGMEDNELPERWTESEIAKSFSSNQLKRLEIIFKCLDVTKDEKLSAKELTSLPNVNVEKLFKGFDQNRDEFISIPEFLKWVKQVKENQSPEIVKMLLEHLVHRCKEKNIEKQTLADEHALQADQMEKIAVGFKQLKKMKAENERLKAENKRLKERMKEP